MIVLILIAFLVYVILAPKFTEQTVLMPHQFMTGIHMGEGIQNTLYSKI